MRDETPSVGCCDYCGLPLAQPRTAAVPASAAPLYCCLGCRWAADITQQSGAEGAQRWAMTRLGFGVFFTLNVMVFAMTLWTYDLYDVSGQTAAAAIFADLLRYFCLLFSLPVLLLLGQPVLVNAIADLRRGLFTIDLLLITGVIASFAFSVIAIINEAGPVYFEVGCMILVMVTLGRWLEANGRINATQALDELEKLLPTEVRRLNTSGEQLVPLNVIQQGDRLRILAGERIPLDGRVVQGSSCVDEQLFTGESWPVEKQTGDSLLGGSLNLDGELQLLVSANEQESVLAKIVAAVRAARMSKGSFQQLADRVASWFFPVVAILASFTCVAHAMVSGWQIGVLTGLSVVLVACPCALGLATPLAIWSALNRAARKGVLFRSGQTMEQLAEVNMLCFDKTGTLTTGRPTVSDIVTDEEISPGEFYLWSHRLAASSEHVFSKAIVEHTVDLIADPMDLPLANIISEPGKGIRAYSSDGNNELYLGNLKLMQQYQQELPAKLSNSLQLAVDEANPITLLACNGKVRGFYVFAEDLRPDAKNVINSLQDWQLESVVLTGDHAARGDRLAGELDVAVQAELLPAEKSEYVRTAQKEGRCVAFIGDGINDAAAMSQADVGIAMSCGADVTREAAEICLISDQLMLVPWSIRLAQKTVSVIRQNLCWAFGYNFVGVAVAMTGYLHPAFAALLMVLSSIFVITNSLRLNRFEQPEYEEEQAENQDFGNKTITKTVVSKQDVASPVSQLQQECVS